MALASFDVSRTGMYVAERGLQVTGHNISNIATEGYTKQQLISNDSRYYSATGVGTVGMGVDVDTLRQLRDTFLDISFRNESSAQSYWGVKKDNLENIQTILDEPLGEGLQQMINQFWNGWQELTKQPDNLTSRALLRQNAGLMVNSFNQVGKQLEKLQNDINNEIITKVTQINDIAKEISQLNVQIRGLEVSGDNANDYRDRRNLLIDKLSKIVDIDAQENPDNLVNISVGGVALVYGGEYNRMTTQQNVPGSSYLSPAWELTGDLVKLKSGSLKGYLEVRGEFAKAEIGSPSNGSPDGIINIDEHQVIPSLKEKLNELFNKLVTQVNTVHSGGYGMDTPPTTGIPFFTVIDSTKPLEMGNIQVNPAFANLNLIAASSNGDKGDSENAQKILDLRNAKLLGSSTDPMTMNEYYRDVISKLGINAQEAQRMSENQDKLVAEITNKKETISGVSLDEEMSNMLKFQHAYQANVRVLNVLDGMLDNIINRMGV